MGRALTAMACAAAVTMLAGCIDHFRQPMPRSLKDDSPGVAAMSHPRPAPKPQAGVARPQTEILPGSVQGVGAISTGTIEPSRPPDGSVIERARAEQSVRCGQRHVDYGKGELQESADEKRLADAICGELHKYDYVR